MIITCGSVRQDFRDYAKAVEHLKQADPHDPFQALLLARAYEKLGQKEDAMKAYQKVIDSQWVGIERPLAYPEAKKRVKAL